MFLSCFCLYLLYTYKRRLIFLEILPLGSGRMWQLWHKTGVMLSMFRYFEVIKGSSGLGLALKGGKDENSPILVKNMQPQGNAFLSGLIDVGDEVVEINTKSFLDTNLKDGIEFLKNLPTGPVRFLTRKK